MAATPKRKHSTRRKGTRRAARKREIILKIKNQNPKVNKHLRSLSSQKQS